MITPSVLFLVGEASGDNWGADLAADLKKRWPQSKLMGLGGPLMEAQGVELIENIAKFSIIGLGGLASKLPFFFSLRRRLVKILVKRKIDLVIAIDFAGFNMSIVRAAHRRNIKVLYYVPPKVWAWGFGRARSVVQSTDHLAVIFPFEEKLWSEVGGQVTFVGHPVLDKPFPIAETRSEFCRKWNLDVQRPILGLFPGSRPQEVQRHLDLFVDVGTRIRLKHPQIQLVIAKSSIIDRLSLQRNDIPIVDDGRALLVHSRAGLLKSGTVTLEACLARTPFVTIYKTDPITWFLAKNLVKIKHVSIPNLLKDRGLIPELLQTDATPEKLVEKLVPLLNKENPEYCEIIESFETIVSSLGKNGVAGRVGQIVESLLRLK